MSSTRKAAVSVAFQIKLTLRRNSHQGSRFTSARRASQNARRCLRLILMDQTQIDKRQLVVDEYSREEVSDESINVNSVLTWNVYSSGRLRVAFEHDFYFDSDSARTNIRPERVQAAIKKLQRLYRVSSQPKRREY